MEEITEGNPLFVTGILEFLKQGGDIIESENGGYELKSEVLEKLPRSIEAVIAKRLDFLDKGLRKILDYASVNGENFALQVIEPLLKMDEIDLARYLGELCKTYDLIMPDADRVDSIKNLSLDFYCFKHTLVHKYVYEDLDETEKKILHRKVAQVLKNLYGENLTRLKEVKALYDRHIKIGKGLIDGITLQLTKGTVNMEDGTEVQSLLEAANAQAAAAEQSYEQYAVNECLESAGKTLAIYKQLKDKKWVERLNELIGEARKKANVRD